jgi:2-polyprenyl-3-methyl-5-hydroxy-6-metoxy-1,4-benzoquinol methylase
MFLYRIKRLIPCRQVAGKIIKKLSPRFVRNINARLIPHAQLGELLFGQQHYGTQAFFREKYGQYHTIPLSLSPHYIFLKDHLGDPFSDHIYAQYLKASWDYLYGDGNTNERRQLQTKKFLNLYHTIENDKAIKEPLDVCTRKDGRIIIIDGNHRAAIALKLGIDVKARFVRVNKYLRKTLMVPGEFYGTARLNMPYQSLFDGEVELVRGRRPDVLERMKMVDERDLRGKSVLEPGCNIGANCYLAVQFGAARATGVDYSPKLITAAIRLNSYFARPCNFIVYDLNKELTDVEPADTVFCFSLVAHINTKSGLVKTIMNKTKHILYFEGHANTELEDYEYLLTPENFSSIECLGYLRDGIHTRKRNRPFFRCEVAK